MQLHVVKSGSEDESCNFTVSVPPTRSDILHPCDATEDVAIAYGYNEIPKRFPASVNPLRLNKFSDEIRKEIAMCGFGEVLNYTLCSSEENFTMLNRIDDRSTAVILGNSCSSALEVVRTSLMLGMLKNAAGKEGLQKPIKIFEVGDISLLEETSDVGSKNRCQPAVLYCAHKPGVEIIHGLVDRVKDVIGAPFGVNASYYFEPVKEPEFLPRQQAKIIYKGKCIGTFGTVHPEVLHNFGILDPCSFVELNIESFLWS